jgi:D-alanine-D-alanine ligase
MGGFSNERRVSIGSGKGIAKALRSRGYEVITHVLNDCWELVDVIKKEKPDVVFNALHGNWGEDGTIQGLLDCLQIPYTHSGLMASCNGMDKQVSKDIARLNGIPIAAGQCLSFSELSTKGTTIPMPFVVKPVSDGSSVGVFIVHNEDDLKNVHYDNENTEILVERYIKGREFTVGVLDGKALAITEICIIGEGFYDYNNKYVAGKAEHFVNPKDLPMEVAETMKHYAEIVFQAFKCNTVCRVDFRYNEDDGPIFLEVNTHPGMTQLSLLPEQAKAVGYSYADLCEALVEQAKCRQR